MTAPEEPASGQSVSRRRFPISTDSGAPSLDVLDTELAELTTEAYRPELANLDQLPTEALVALMNDEDRQVPQAVAACAEAITEAIDGVAGRLSDGGRLIYVGAGTAGRLGVLDASECPPTFSTPPDQVVALIAGGPDAMTRAVEGAEDDRDTGGADLAGINVTARDAVVGVSASGRTPYVLGALEHARSVGAFTVALSCNAGSAIGRIAAVAVEVVVGAEVLSGSTRLKAGTAQKLVLNMISTISMIRLGKTYGNLMVDLRVSNDKLRSRARRIVAAAAGRDDDEAAAALAAAGGDVKAAILMLVSGVELNRATEALDASGGRLRDAVELVVGA